MNEHLRVGLRGHPVPAGEEFLPEFEEIINFAVEDHLDRAVLVALRLFARAEIDDAQPPVRQAHAAVDEETVLVGTAVNQPRRHLAENLPRIFGFPCPLPAGDAAHDEEGFTSPPPPGQETLCQLALDAEK